MTAQTGRTVEDFTNFLISQGGSMRQINIDTLGDVGLDYPAVEMRAFQDLVRGSLVGKPNFGLDFEGPVDNTATTGTSTVLRALAGQQTALSFDVQFGVRHAWEAGEPQFGVTGVVASNSGVWVTKYSESGGRFKSRIEMLAGSVAAPAWGTAAEVVPA